MSAQKLLEMAEDGVYDKNAVNRLLKKKPTAYNQAIEYTSSNGDGKTYVGDARKGHKEFEQYEVLRFQGLFTEEDELRKIKKKREFWIDIGERTEVLRIQENPLLGNDKTFCLANYDSMISEFATDGVIAPIKSLNYEINDKENQSLDAVSFDLNAPFEVVKSSGLIDSDIEEIYEVPHKALWVRERNSIQKVRGDFNVGHVNAEIVRLTTTSDNIAGSTSLAAGAPTGTQADRSGKALSILQDQTRSQFSKFIRKFERRFLQRSLQKLWKMIMQFSDDQIEIELFGEEENEEGEVVKTVTPFNQKVSEIIGQFNIKVTGGSQYLKERDMRDSILEFISVASTNDVFMQMLDPEEALLDIAKASPHDMTKYVDPNNLYQQQKQQIQQLTQMLEQANEQLKLYGGELKRVNSELAQTDRNNQMTSPSTVRSNK